MDTNQRATIKSEWFTNLPRKQQDTYLFCISVVNKHGKKSGSKWTFSVLTAPTKHALTGQIFRTAIEK